MRWPRGLMVVLAGASSLGLGDAPAKRYKPPTETVLVPVTNLGVRDTANLMRIVLRGDPDDSASGAVRVTAAPSGNALIIAGPRQQIEAARDIVRAMDRPLGIGVIAGDPTAMMDATVYLLPMESGRLASLSASELTADAADAAKFQKRLSGLGPVQVSQRFLQRVNLVDGSKISGASSAPFVTGTQVARNGQVNTQIQYQDIGCKIDLDPGTAMTSGSGITNLAVECSTTSSGDVNIGNGLKALVFIRIRSKYEGPISDGKPIVVVGTSPSPDAKTPGMACITRIVFSNANK